MMFFINLTDVFAKQLRSLKLESQLLNSFIDYGTDITNIEIGVH